MVRDALIIGGGPAGLSATLTLYRALHTCTVFDSRKSRLLSTDAIHLTNTWEFQHPNEFFQSCRSELAQSQLVDFVETQIIRVERIENDHIKIVDSKSNEWIGRTLLLAQGVGNIYPSISGYEGLFAKRIFPCMFQYGYEFRGAKSAGLLAVDGLDNSFHALKLADDGHKFCDDMTIYTNGNEKLAQEIKSEIADPRMQVDDRPIEAMELNEGAEGVILRFADGSWASETFIVHRPLTKLDTTLAKQLQLALSPMGEILVHFPFNATSISNIFAAGDCASPLKIAPHAMAMGASAGAGMARILPKRITMAA